MAKTVLITGASSGIGRVTAELMAQRGWQVAATSREPAALRAWAAEANVVVLPLDVTEEPSVAAAVSAVVDRFGGIDVLVNNAGTGFFGPLEAATPEQVEVHFRTNLFGSIALIRHVMPVMRSRHSGTIVNVSSIGGRTAAPFGSLYHAAKFAIEGLSESFRYEASLHGIRVKVVEPAHFKTGFISRSLVLSGHSAYDTQLRNYMEWVHDEDHKAPAPRPVAEAILRAAEDPSPRLRYPVKGALILALTSLLPDALWRLTSRSWHDAAPEGLGDWLRDGRPNKATNMIGDPICVGRDDVSGRGLYVLELPTPRLEKFEPPARCNRRYRRRRPRCRRTDTTSVLRRGEAVS